MLRWARGLGVALGVILLFALWMLGGAAWITARPADPMLWPARDARIVEVHVVSNGYHAGLALPRAALAEFAGGRGYPALIAVTQRFAAYDWIEFGWGDRAFYQSVPTVGDMNLRLALITLVFVPISALSALKIGSYVRPVWTAIQQQNAVLTTFLQESNRSLTV